MNKITLLLLIFFNLIAYSQEVNQLEITPNGVNGYVVKTYEGKNEPYIYGKLKNGLNTILKIQIFSKK